MGLKCTKCGAYSDEFGISFVHDCNPDPSYVELAARYRKALETIAAHYVAEARQNDWVECCKLKKIAEAALSQTDNSDGK